MYLSKTRTDRGFQLIQFEDCYNQVCSMQESSNLKKQIWLGADKVSYDENDEPYNSRICLGRSQSLKVAIRLILFALTGRLFHKKKHKSNYRHNMFDSKL